jgi:hypothetical protein
MTPFNGAFCYDTTLPPSGGATSGDFNFTNLPETQYCHSLTYKIGGGSPVSFAGGTAHYEIKVANPGGKGQFVLTATMPGGQQAVVTINCAAPLLLNKLPSTCSPSPFPAAPAAGTCTLTVPGFTGNILAISCALVTVCPISRTSEPVPSAQCLAAAPCPGPVSVACEPVYYYPVAVCEPRRGCLASLFGRRGRGCCR